MNYSLSYSLGKRLGIQDPDAASYILAVRAAGGTVTSAQSSEINTFYKAAKSAGYYTSLKRLYLPIWGVAAANAIDMITGASGTWNGGVTHGAGFVQGNGTTGYFDLGESPSSLGFTLSGASLFALAYTSNTSNRTLIGCSDGSSKFSLRTGLSGMTAEMGGTVSISAGTGRSGIGVALRGSVTYLISAKRNNAGTATATSATDVTGAAIPSDNITAMALNTSGVISEFSTSQMGLYGASTESVYSSGFVSILETLWESCTGLTLP